MSTFDMETLLAAVRPGMPCGEDVTQAQELRGLWDSLSDLLRPRSLGAVPRENEQLAEPDWGKVARQSFSLLQGSKDLRVALYFALAVFMTEGLTGLRDGLYVIHGLLERYWDDLYPRLDPEDGNDPTERLNTLLPLSSEPVTGGDPVHFHARLLRVPLCHSPRVGKFCLRDIQIARGEQKAPEGLSAVPEMPVIVAAFRETAVEQLRQELADVRQATEYLDGIRAVFRERAAGGAGPDLTALRADLGKIGGMLEEYVGLDGHAGGAGPARAPVETLAGGKTLSISGEVRSREDALAAIDRACQYFEQHERSSPVPLLLRRARSLASKTFLEIIEDVCPSAIDQVAAVSGTAETKKGEST
ncbi:MAG: type VI secretion system protein TssA [Planctomycetes bacterium]|jgi:type VI secretion system protein ImpA|nr:type VI secretion system protein TssA [Planctomycetota bacterium]